MTSRPPSAELALPPGEAVDPDLEALPEPRRPGRNLTLVAMTLTAVLALLMAFMLRGEATYALRSEAPVELENLAELTPRPELANRLVHGDALLGSTGAIRYGRPLEGDTFRLAPVAGNDKVWVEIRVPEGMEGPRFVPPTSFVGRLVPFAAAGLGHSDLAEAVEEATHAARVPPGAWILIDDQTPASTRWALGLIGLFLGFAAFNLYGLYRLTRPVG